MPTCVSASPRRAFLCPGATYAFSPRPFRFGMQTSSKSREAEVSAHSGSSRLTRIRPPKVRTNRPTLCRGLHSCAPESRTGDLPHQSGPQARDLRTFLRPDRPWIMKILVIGSTGPQGREFVAQALAAGHAVCAFARNPAALQPARALRWSGATSSISTPSTLPPEARMPLCRCWAFP